MCLSVTAPSSVNVVCLAWQGSSSTNSSKAVQAESQIASNVLGMAILEVAGIERLLKLCQEHLIQNINVLLLIKKPEK